MQILTLINCLLHTLFHLLIILVSRWRFIIGTKIIAVGRNSELFQANIYVGSKPFFLLAFKYLP